MKLELFYFDACPFCQKVLREVERLNVKVDYKNIMENPENKERLINDTGRKTTPCLYVDDEPLFESDDIINWLRENIDKLDKLENSKKGANH